MKVTKWEETDSLESIQNALVIMQIELISGKMGENVSQTCHTHTHTHTHTEEKTDPMWRVRIFMCFNVPHKYTAWMTKKLWKLLIEIQNSGKGTDLGDKLERIRMFQIKTHNLVLAIRTVSESSRKVSEPPCSRIQRWSLGRTVCWVSKSSISRIRYITKWENSECWKKKKNKKNKTAARVCRGTIH